VLTESTYRKVEESYQQRRENSNMTDENLSLQVGTPIRVIEGNVLGGYRKGLTGRIVSVLQNSFTGEILYRCDIDGADGTENLILLPSEIEPILVKKLSKFSP
jgi:hypothetical protein